MLRSNRSDIAGELRQLHSFRFGDTEEQPEQFDSLGHPVGSPGADTEMEMRYCIRCGQPIERLSACSNPDCGAPNFFRDIAGPGPKGGPGQRSTLIRGTPPSRRTTTTSSGAEHGRTDPAFAVLRSLSSPPVAYALYPGGMEIGARAPANIVIDRPDVSARHARLESDRDPGGSWEVILTDCDSTNGTFVNGEQIQRRRLEHGDRIRFGAGEFQLRFLSEENRRRTVRIDSDR